MWCEVYSVDLEACGNQYIKTRGQKKKLQRELVLPFSDCSRDMNLINLSGSCNGLLCISYFDSLYLLNPATNEYKMLPYPQNFSPHLTVFGYSPRTDEYKVMIIRMSWIQDSLYWDDVYGYTLGTNSSWRSIGHTEYRIKCSRNHALVNGALHWMARRDTPDFSIVSISFDLGDEKLRELSLPKCFSHDDIIYHSTGLTELGSFLSLYHRKVDGKFDIWVMKDYGDERSWTKVFSSGQPILSRIHRYFRPLCILKKDEFVLCQSEYGLLILDVVKKQIRKLQLSHALYYRVEVMHLESLVSLRAIGEMNCGNKQ